MEAVLRKPRLAEDKIPENGLHIGGLTLDTTNDDLSNLFKAFTTTFVEVITPRPGANFAHAVVCVEDEEDMQKAIDALNNAKLKGNEIFVQVRRAANNKKIKKRRKNKKSAAAAAATTDNTKKTDGTKTRRRRKKKGPVFPPNALYIGNLSWGVDDDEFKKLFADVATTYAEVQRIATGRSRGYGIVCLENAQDMDKIIAQFNGMDVDG